MKNKNLWITLAVVLVAVVSFMVWSNITSEPLLPLEDSANEESLLDEEVVLPVVKNGSEDKTTGSVNTTKPVSMSYAEALAKYKDARIQLDPKCQATPNNVTFKNGTTVMIDNRAPVARTVKIGSVFTIKAYGFKIMQLSSTKLPATLLVDCDLSENVATILLQK